RHPARQRHRVDRRHLSRRRRGRLRAAAARVVGAHHRGGRRAHARLPRVGDGLGRPHRGGLYLLVEEEDPNRSGDGGSMRFAFRKPLAIFALAALAACGGEGRPEFLSLGTAGTGGIYYPLGGAIASRLSVNDPLRQYTAEVSGGSEENISRLSQGQMDLAMTIGMTVYQAYHGEGSFAQPNPALRSLVPLYPNVTHVLVRGGLPVQSVGDFEGLRVSVGAAGSGTEALSQHVLAAYGLTYNDIQPRYLSFAESSTALQDGAIDAAI